MRIPEFDAMLDAGFNGFDCMDMAMIYYALVTGQETPDSYITQAVNMGILNSRMPEWKVWIVHNWFRIMLDFAEETDR